MGRPICTAVPTRHQVSVDGETVVAVHHDGSSDRWVFFSHGFVSDKSGSYESRCTQASEKGLQAVRFDHRGCGESDRSFGEQDFETRLADLQAVIEYFDPSECILFGSSFGGKVAFHTAISDSRVIGVAVRAPVTRTKPFENYRSLSESFFAALSRHPFERVEQQLDVPVAMFHGRDDETVPLDGTLDAIAGFKTDVLCAVYAGEGHRFSRDAENRMRDRLFAWIDDI